MVNLFNNLFTAGKVSHSTPKFINMLKYVSDISSLSLVNQLRGRDRSYTGRSHKRLTAWSQNACNEGKEKLVRMHSGWFPFMTKLHICFIHVYILFISLISFCNILTFAPCLLLFILYKLLIFLITIC